MRVIFVLNSPYPNYTGGRETWVFNVCNRLVEYYNVEVISYKCKHPNPKRGTFTGIDSRVKMVPAPNLGNFVILRPFFRWYLNYVRAWIDALGIFFTLKKRLRMSDERTVIITLDTVYLAKVANLSRKANSNITHICSVRCPHAEITGSYYPLFAKSLLNIERRNLRMVDAIWANGYDTQRNLKQKGFDSTVIYNGTDINKIELYENDRLPAEFRNTNPKIVTIGTLLDYKGYPQLIKAVSLIHKKYNIRMHLFAFGKGSQVRYTQLACDEKIEEYVHFMGEVRDAAAYAKCADIVACLGTSEGSGLSMAMLESMASGCPVIGWDIFSTNQLITHRKSGYLVPEKDVIALADEIFHVLQHPNEGAIVANRAREIAKSYDWRNVVNQILSELGKNK